MGIHHHEQDIGLPSKLVFSYNTKGYAQILLNYLCSCIKYKIEFSVCKLKINHCVIYIVMRLIPWKQSHGSETYLEATANFVKFFI
jgi:hypothetical protein